MKRCMLLAALALGVLCVFHDSASAGRRYRARRYVRSRTIRRSTPVYRVYRYNPVASGSTRQNQLRSSPRPIQFQQPRWVDPGAYRSPYPANYGPGTGKSGPRGQRLYIHSVPYQGSSGNGYAPGVIRLRRTQPPGGGSAGGRNRFGYDDNRSKSLP